jgi:hypothetical protein
LLQVDSVEREENIETIQIESHGAIGVLWNLVVGSKYTDERGASL